MSEKINISINKIKQNSNLPLIIGFFDSIHKGHNRLFKLEKKFNVLTFINLPNKKNNFINQFDKRIEYIENYNPKNIYILDVEKNNVSADEFMLKILKKINPTKIIVGSNFLFGKNNTGNTQTLKKYFEVCEVKVNKKYSTTKSKKWINKGIIEKFNKININKFSIEGMIVSGDKVGKKLNAPTLNVVYPNELVKLRSGSYITKSIIDGKNYNSISFVGASKTFNKNNYLIETNILNKNFIHNKNNITIIFYKFIRKNKKFSNEKKLTKAIRNDINKAKTFFYI